MQCSTCERIAKGTLGITKSVLGLQRLSIEKTQQRLAVCRQCPDVEMCPGTRHRVCRCKLCGCHLKHKARLKNEACPAGKW